MGWRTRFISMLIVYFAGFATAIYMLVPGSESEERAAVYERSDKTLNLPEFKSEFKSEEFAKSFKVSMDKCLDFSRDTAIRAGIFIKEKIDERQQQADS